MHLIRIATRNSPLALWQANFVKDSLLNIHKDLEVEIVGMTTKGDQLLDRSLAKIGGKGLFLKELEVSLLNNETDIAVHSMKDVPVEMPEGLEIPVVCAREDARDAFVSNDYQNLYALPEGAKIGTSSLRRVSQLKHAFPKCEFVELRGNVNTRLKKLDEGKYDAIILASAGLIRLGFESRIRQYINPNICLPAVGQGIVGIQCRTDDEDVKALIAPLHDSISDLCLTAERSLNAKLEGGCQVPIAGYAELNKSKLMLQGLVGSVDGLILLKSNITCIKNTPECALKLGADVAEELLGQGAGELLREIYEDSINAQQETKKANEILKQELVAKQKKMRSSKCDQVNINSGKKLVILTRQCRYIGNMPIILERLDYEPIHIPTLKIDIRVREDVISQLKQLEIFTDIVFVSRNAVEIGMPLIIKHGGLPDSIRVLAVGAETAKQLHQYDVQAMYPDVGSGAEALLRVSQLNDLTGRRILVVRGDNSLVWPDEKMRERGAEIRNLVVYYQTMPETCSPRFNDVFNSNSEVACIFAHSPRSVLNMIEAAGDHFDKLINTKLIAGSKGIASTAKNHGWKGEILIAESPANKHMILTFSE